MKVTIKERETKLRNGTVLKVSLYFAKPIKSSWFVLM